GHRREQGQWVARNHAERIPVERRHPRDRQRADAELTSLSLGWSARPSAYLRVDRLEPVAPAGRAFRSVVGWLVSSESSRPPSCLRLKHRAPCSAKGWLDRVTRRKEGANGPPAEAQPHGIVTHRRHPYLRPFP